MRKLKGVFLRFSVDQASFLLCIVSFTHGLHPSAYQGGWATPDNHIHVPGSSWCLYLLTVSLSLTSVSQKSYLVELQLPLMAWKHYMITLSYKRAWEINTF